MVKMLVTTGNSNPEVLLDAQGTSAAWHMKPRPLVDI